MRHAPSIPPADLGPDIQRFLAAFAALHRMVETLAALGRTLALGMAWLLAQCLIDRWAALPAWARLALLVTGTIVTIAPLLAQFLRLRRPPNWQRIAAQIEQRDPRFEQRLETVVSQLYFPPALRGSPQMLDELRVQVAQQARSTRPAALASWKKARTPWIAVLGFFLLGLVLWNVDYLQLPQLLHRSLAATAPLSAVSVTQLEVQPGDAAVLQGSAMTIRVLGRRLGQKPVLLYLGGRSGTFSEVEMQRQGTIDGTTLLNFTLGSVDRDLRYYVRGGDALSRIYNVRVQRVPTVAEYRVLYHYPPLVRRPDQSVESTDGHLEAPAGSSAELMLIATEPLGNAAVLVEGRSLALTSAGANAWKITLSVSRDMTCPLELTSAQGVVSAGLSLSIHAIPDHPPLVRLFTSGTPDLLLEPRQVLRLRYEAVDEYEVDKMALRTWGAGPETVKPLPLHAPARRVADVCLLDLATLNLRLGDMLSVAVGAEDSAQQWGWSTPARHILVVEHGLGSSHWQSVTELKSAAGMATDWTAALDRARLAWEALLEADPASPNRWGLLIGAQHASTNAADLAADLRLALLRSLWHSQIPDGETPLPLAGAPKDQSLLWPDASLGDALADDVDLTFLIAADIATSRDAESPSLLMASTAQARALAQQLTTLWQGHAAAIALTMSADLASFGSKTAPASRDSTEPAIKPAERRSTALAQAHQTLAALMGELGVKSDASDLNDVLGQRIAAAHALASAQTPKNWSEILRQWDARNDPGEAPLLAQRLELAAQTQALRGTGAGSLLWARDLHLAGAALAAVQKPEEQNQPALAGAEQQFPAWLELLRQEDFSDPHAPIADAQAARAHLTALANASPAPTARQIATLVFDANAASALAQIERADALDKELLDVLASAAPEEAARFKPTLLQLRSQWAGLCLSSQRQEPALPLGQTTLLRLAQLRLQMIPTLAPVFAPSEEEPTASVQAASFLRSAGGWRSGHPTTLPESAAPAYQEAVRAYFDALAHSRDEKPKR